jgi:transposase
MSKIPKLFVGIDFHQKISTVCVMDGRGTVVLRADCESSAEYIHKFVHWSLESKKLRLQAAVEACGGSAKLAEDLRRLGWEIDLAHASTVARLGKNLDKTDPQDAYVLADLVRVGYLPRVFLAPERQRQLRSLVRYREQLAKQRKQTKQRIRGLMRESHLRISSASAWTLAWVAQLRERMSELGEERAWICEQLLDQLKGVCQRLAAAEKRLKPAVENAPGSEQLLKQPGIGLVTAGMLLAEIGDFTRFRNGKQLSRYCGLAPVNCSSGERERQSGIGKACNGDLRRMLIEASHRLSRYVPRWRDMKNHLLRQGKKKAVAAVAVANRWLRRLHYDMTRPDVCEKTAA